MGYTFDFVWLFGFLVRSNVAFVFIDGNLIWWLQKPVGCYCFIIINAVMWKILCYWMHWFDNEFLGNFAPRLVSFQYFPFHQYYWLDLIMWLGSCVKIMFTWWTVLDRLSCCPCVKQLMGHLVINLIHEAPSLLLFHNWHTT